MEKYELAFEDYKQGMKYKDIAEKYDVSINTVKSWKSRKWGSPPEVATKKKGCTQKQKKVAHKKEVQTVQTDMPPDDITDILEYYEIDERQRKFADNFIEGGVIETAALDAGYSKSYSRSLSYQLLANIGIKNYINDRMRVLSHGKIATQEEILQGLTKIFTREAEEHQVVTIREKVEKWVPMPDGTLKKQTIETETPRIVPYPSKVSDAIKAGEAILKRHEAGGRLIQANIEKVKAETRLVNAKLDSLERGEDETTEEKLDELLNRISGEIDELD